MHRSQSIVLVLVCSLLMAACAPAVPVPTAVPTTVTAAPTNTAAPTATLAPTLTLTPTEVPTPIPTLEDFSDLHPEMTLEGALNNPESILAREDLGRAVRKALAEAKPYPEGTEPAKFILVRSPTGMKYVDYEENYYGLHPELIPSRIEGIYQFKDIPGVNGVLMIVSYLTPDGIKVITYNFDPTEGDPRLKLVDQHILITPISSDPNTESDKEFLKKYSDEECTIELLQIKHHDEVSAALDAMIDTGTIPDDLWKTPLRPNTDWATLRSDITATN